MEACSGLWRSEEVVRLDLYIQREVLHRSIFLVGLLGRAQFIDLNEGEVAFSRPYTEYIRRCEDIERKLAFIETEIKKSDLTVHHNDINMCASLGEIEETFFTGQLDMIEEEVKSAEMDLSAMIQSMEGLQNEINNNEEISLLFERLTELVTVNELQAELDPQHPLQHLSRISSVVGMIDSTQTDVLYRICYRVTRGNAIISINHEAEPLLNPKTGEKNVYRSTFAIFSTSPKMIAKVKKLIESLRTTLYSIEEVESRGVALQQAAAAEDSGWEEMRVRDQTVRSTNELCRDIEGVERRKEAFLVEWYQKHRVYKLTVQVEKSVLSTMNGCTFSGSTCTASVWIASKYEPLLEQALIAAAASSGEVQSIITRNENAKRPPTYFETNRFTVSFQSIVDSYGMARYKEINPGVFTIITFPYLFGIMYGDIGHGVLLLLFALYFIYKERSWRVGELNEIVGMVFGGRYLLLLMALFAIYMGFLYNDFLGFSVNIFPSGYIWPSLSETNESVVHPLVPDGKPSVKPTHTYAFGLDSSWAETDNKLEFYNSVKMKCAVIVGVVQMFAGIVLSLFNHIYRKDWFRIAFLTVPEFIFLWCTFGYMSILIIVKWCTTWSNTNDAPSILETMTNFFLSPGYVNKPLFRGQAGLQVFLLIFAFLMVPIMLCGMPIVEYRRYRRHLRSLTSLVPNEAVAPQEDTPDAALSSSDGEVDVFEDVVDIIAEQNDTEEEEYGPNYDFSEVVIHYLIHTIEYVLSSVSNTASYLRLWALSLAHAQLSEVFFTFAIVNVLSADTTGALVAMSVLIWLAVTLAVLVGMEALSAFLHALRLHWVEFQNKFYAGDGVGLEPLDLHHLDGRR